MTNSYRYVVITRQKIVLYLQENGPSSGAAIAETLTITRQAVNKHIKKLVLEGRVQKTGSTKRALYFLTEEKAPEKQAPKYQKKYQIKKMQEDEIYNEFSLIMNLKNNLSPAAHSIVNYAFTEMVNNVIEHSDSENCLISAELDAYSFSFTVRDFGIGIFARIAEYYELTSEEAGMQELLKGKRTSLPDRHTGEGVFLPQRQGIL